MKSSLRIKIIGIAIGLASIFWIWRWTSFLIHQYEIADEPYGGLICFAYPPWVHYLNITVGFLGIVIAILILKNGKIGVLKWYLIILVLVGFLTSFLW